MKPFSGVIGSAHWYICSCFSTV